MTQTALPQTSTFHQPTTGTAASAVATCTTCKRSISRMNGGSALWIDDDGHVSCAPKVAAPASKTELPADIEVKRTEHPDLPFQLVATDDNPSHLGTWKISENQAYALLLHLAQELGATIVTAGQQQDLGLLVRETIADADSRKNTPAAVGSSAVLLNSMTDAMRDLRDTFRRAGITD